VSPWEQYQNGAALEGRNLLQSIPQVLLINCKLVLDQQRFELIFEADLSMVLFLICDVFVDAA